MKLYGSDITRSMTIKLIQINPSFTSTGFNKHKHVLCNKHNN